MNGGKRAVAVWHRRAGKDTTALNLTVRKMFQRVGVYYHCFPEYSQGRKILWDGIDREGKRFMDYFPTDLIANKNRQEMRLELINGSIWQIIGADNYDAVVGANPVGLVMSEWAISPRYESAWNYFRPMLAENGGWALFIYTPRGMNQGYTLYEMAKENKDWFAELLTVDDTRAISPEDIQAERDAGMNEDMIQQEFYCSFTVVGARPFNFSPRTHCINPLPIPQSSPIYMAFDWGFGKPFAVVWAWVDGEGRCYQFGEWYGWNGKPDQGLRMEDSVIAQGIIAKERELGIQGRNIIRLAGHDCWNKKPDYKGGGQGPSTAELFAGYGLYLQKADPDRALKLRQFRERMRLSEDGTRPMLMVYDTCRQTIRTLPLIAVDERNVEDVDTTGEDHLYDALCQIAMARPLAAPGPALRPLTMFEKDMLHITGIDPRHPEHRGNGTAWVDELETEIDRDYARQRW